MNRTIPDEYVTLDDLARSPLRASTLSADVALKLSAQLEVVRGVLKARRMFDDFGNLADSDKAAASHATGDPDRRDRLLRADEAAPRLGIAKETLYRNADEYPFTRRVRPRCLRFSELGIEAYQRGKKRDTD